MLNLSSITFLLFLLNPISLKSPPSIISLQTNCLKNLIANFLPTDSTLYFILENPNQKFKSIQPGPNPRIILDITKPISKDLRNYNAYLIYTDGYTSLKNTLTKLKKSKVWNENESPRKKFLIIAPSFQEDFFKILWSFDIVNAILIVGGKIYTSDPFLEENNCGKRVKKYFTNNCGVLKFNQSTKLNGCPLTLLGNNLTKNFKKVPCLGILGYLFEFMGKILNTTTTNSIKKNEKESHYNHTEGILFSHTLTRDLVWLKDYELSDIFYRDKLVWVIPKGEKIPTIKIMFLICDCYVWISIGIIFLTVTTLVWVIANASEEVKGFKLFWRGFLSILALTLCSVDNLRPKTNALKFIAFFYSLYSVQVSTSLQAHLTSIFTQPLYSHRLNTVEELSESKLIPVLSGNAIKLNFSATYNEQIASNFKKKILHVPQVNLYETLMQLVMNHNISALVSKDSIKVCLQGGETVVDVLDSKFLTMEMTLAMRKGHFFLNTFNKLLTVIYENGFYERIFKMAMSQSEFVGETFDVALGMDHLGSIFICWASGLFLASIGFALELLKSNCKKEIPEDRLGIN